MLGRERMRLRPPPWEIVIEGAERVGRDVPKISAVVGTVMGTLAFVMSAPTVPVRAQVIGFRITTTKTRLALSPVEILYVYIGGFTHEAVSKVFLSTGGGSLPSCHRLPRGLRLGLNLNTKNQTAPTLSLKGKWQAEQVGGFVVCPH